MTKATLEKGQQLLAEIDKLKDRVHILTPTLDYDYRPAQPKEKKWWLRLANIWGDDPDAPPEGAKVVLFNDISSYGKDIPVDESLMECLKDFFEKKLNDKQHEFDVLGD